VGPSDPRDMSSAFPFILSAYQTKCLLEIYVMPCLTSKPAFLSVSHPKICFSILQYRRL
jgi:hypothetical protein